MSVRMLPSVPLNHSIKYRGMVMNQRGLEQKKAFAKKICLLMCNNILDSLYPHNSLQGAKSKKRLVKIFLPQALSSLCLSCFCLFDRSTSEPGQITTSQKATVVVSQWVGRRKADEACRDRWVKKRGAGVSRREESDAGVPKGACTSNVHSCD